MRLDDLYRLLRTGERIEIVLGDKSEVVGDAQVARDMVRTYLGSLRGASIETARRGLVVDIVIRKKDKIMKIRVRINRLGKITAYV